MPVLVLAGCYSHGKRGSHLPARVARRTAALALPVRKHGAALGARLFRAIWPTAGIDQVPPQVRMHVGLAHQEREIASCARECRTRVNMSSFSVLRHGVAFDPSDFTSAYIPSDAGDLIPEGGLVCPASTTPRKGTWPPCTPLNTTAPPATSTPPPTTRYSSTTPASTSSTTAAAQATTHVITSTAAPTTPAPATGITPVPPPPCGNGIVDKYQSFCWSDVFSVGVKTCRDDDELAIQQSVSGMWFLTEECDDGGNPPVSGDGCSDICTIEERREELSFVENLLPVQTSDIQIGGDAEGFLHAVNLGFGTTEGVEEGEGGERVLHPSTGWMDMSFMRMQVNGSKMQRGIYRTSNNDATQPSFVAYEFACPAPSTTLTAPTGVFTLLDAVASQDSTVSTVRIAPPESSHLELQLFLDMLKGETVEVFDEVPYHTIDAYGDRRPLPAPCNPCKYLGGATAELQLTVGNPSTLVITSNSSRQSLSSTARYRQVCVCACVRTFVCFFVCSVQW